MCYMSLSDISCVICHVLYVMCYYMSCVIWHVLCVICRVVFVMSYICHVLITINTAQNNHKNT